MGSGVSWLVRLYPRAWRKRYGAELETLIHETPGRAGVALDLLVGAAIAYRDVIRGNRVLSASGAYLHGVCVAVLLQAILFLSLVFVGQRSTALTDLSFGPIDLVTFQPPVFFGGLTNRLASEVVVQKVILPLITEVVLLAALLAALAFVLAIPRLVRSLR